MIVVWIWAGSTWRHGLAEVWFASGSAGSSDQRWQLSSAFDQLFLKSMCREEGPHQFRRRRFTQLPWFPLVGRTENHV